MKKNKLVIGIVLVLFGLFFIWFIYLKNYKENRLMKEGKNILDRVEIYKQEKGILPNSLSDIGIKENENTENEIKYQRQDTTHFYIWLGISSEESKFYYSDSRKWENSYREMK